MKDRGTTDRPEKPESRSAKNKPDSKVNKGTNRERGNVFFTLFGAVAIIGILGAGIMATMRGPLSTMVEVNNRTKASTEMQLAARLAAVEATKVHANSGDCDSDGMIEPLPWKTDIAGLGGGTLPDEVSSSKVDPWGTAYGYCAFDPDTVQNDAACDNGSVPASHLIAGNGVDGDDSYVIIALVSAGPDRTFDTVCSGGATPKVTKGGDDIVESYTYAQANAVTGGLWTAPDAATASISRNLDVTGGAKFSDNIDLRTNVASMLLPTETQLQDSECPGASNVNVGLLRINTSVTPNTLEICNTSGWESSGSSLWSHGTGDSIYYNPTTPKVGIGNNNPAYTLDVTGTGNVSGAFTVGGTGNVAGNFTAQSLIDAQGALYNTTGDLTLNDDSIVVGTFDARTSIFNSTGNLKLDDAVDVTGALGVTGATTLSSTLDVTGATTLNSTLDTKGAATFESTIDAQDAISNNTTTNGGDVYINDAATVTGTATFNGTGNSIVVTNDADLNGNVDVFGNYTSTSGNLTLTNGDISAHNVTATNDIKGGNDVLIGSLSLVPPNCGDTSADKLVWSSSTGWTCTSDQNDGSSGSGSGNGIFEIVSNVARVKDAAGDWSADDFVFGSPTLDYDSDTTHAGRFFFDKATGAFRAGYNAGTGWDNTNLGNYSAAFGQSTSATADFSFATGYASSASGTGAFAAGQWATASGSNSTATGNGVATASGAIAMGDAANSPTYNRVWATKSGAIAMGLGLSADGLSSIALGRTILVEGDYSMGLGLGNQTGSMPQVTASNAFAIFLGDQGGYDLSTANRMALLGGDFLIDDDGKTGSQGCLRYNGTNSELEFSNDCVTFNSITDLGTQAPGNDTEVIYNDNGALAGDSGMTYDAANNILTVDNSIVINGQSGDQPTFANLDDLGDVTISSAADGECLTYDNASSTWINGTCGSGSGSNVFEVTGSAGSEVVRQVDANAPYATADFLFGSPTLDYDSDATHANRMFFDKAKGAFRAGVGDNSNWNNANLGAASIGLGADALASGTNSVAIGTTPTASGTESVAIGSWNSAGGNRSISLGYSNFASGAYSFAIGHHTSVTGGSGAIGVGYATGTVPKVSANDSLGIFLGDQSGYDLATANRMALVGGDFLIDDAGATGSNGCIRYNGSTSHLQYSNDCSTWSDFGSGSGGLWTDNTTHITRSSVHLLNTGETMASAGLDSLQNNTIIWITDKGALRVGTSNNTSWDDANIGTNSFTAGRLNYATGNYSVALGDGAEARASGAVALNAGTASGVRALATIEATASGNRSIAMGQSNIAAGADSVAIGHSLNITGDYSMGIGLGYDADSSGEGDPIVSATNSFGIFMGDQSGVDLSTANTMAIMGGNVGIGTVAPNATLDILSANNQFRASYDTTHYMEYNNNGGNGFLGHIGGNFYVETDYGSEITLKNNTSTWAPSAGESFLTVHTANTTSDVPATAGVSAMKIEGGFGATTAKTFTGTLTGLGINYTFGNGANATYNDTTTPMAALSINSTANVNTASTGGYSMIYGDTTATSLSATGSNRLIDLRVNGNDTFWVGTGGTLHIDNDGSTGSSGCVRYNGTNSQLEYSDDCTTYTAFADIGSGSGVTAFTGLSDTPSAFATYGGQYVRVNSGETALEFTDQLVASVTGQPAPSFMALGDVDDVTLTSVADGECLTYDNASSTWVNASCGGGSSLWTDNTTHITRGNWHIINSGQTSDTAGLSINGGGAAGSRVFYNQDKATLVGGSIAAANDAWDAANVGTNSIAWGSNAQATGTDAVAFGLDVTTTGDYSMTLGSNVSASGNRNFAGGQNISTAGNRSFAFGYNSGVTGSDGYALGHYAYADGSNMALMNEVNVTGDYALGIGLGTAAGTDPIVSGISSLGIFMGDQSGYDLSAADTLALVGGQMMIDDDGSTASTKGCIKYNGTTSHLQYSNDCSSYSDFGSGSGGLWTDNTQSISRQNFYVLNTGETSDSAGLSINGGGSAGIRAFYDPDKGALRGGTVTAASNAWDSANIGFYSFGWGRDAKASNNYSIAMGDSNIASGAASVALGYANTASGAGAVSLGNDNSAQGASSLVLANGSRAYAAGGVAIGSDVYVGYPSGGTHSMAFGVGNASTWPPPSIAGNNSVGFFLGDQSGVSLADSNTFAIMGASGGIGIGTVSPSYDLSFEGTAAHTIGMEDNTTAATVGSDLTISAGAATAGGTDKDGGDLVLAAGKSTGNGWSAVRFQGSERYGGGSNTATNSLVDLMALYHDGNQGTILHIYAPTGYPSNKIWFSGVGDTALTKGNTYPGVTAIRINPGAHPFFNNYYTSVPADGEFGNSEWAVWIDETNNVFKIKGKESDGTVITGTLGGGGASALNDLSDAWTDYTTYHNMAIGQNAGTTGNNALRNISIGENALNSQADSATCDGSSYYCDDNIAIGYNALTAATIGAGNIAIGSNTLAAATDTGGNVAIGEDALTASTGGSNVAIGGAALITSTVGNSQTMIGFRAGRYSNTGFVNALNTAVGAYVMQGVNGSSTGAANVAMGYDTMGSYTTADRTVAIGTEAANALSSGDYNTILGASAGQTLTTGSSNILIGYNIDVPTAATSNYLSIGNTIYGDLSNKYVGIGNTTPQDLIDVNSTTGNAYISVGRSTAAFTTAGLILYSNRGDTTTGIDNAANTGWSIETADCCGGGSNDLLFKNRMNSNPAAHHAVMAFDSVADRVGVGAGIDNDWFANATLHVEGSADSEIVSIFQANAGGTPTGDLTQWRDKNDNVLSVVDVNGNFGIGTASPSVSLDIAATDAIIIPVGTDAQRPGTPTAGMLRYNTTASGDKLEFYDAENTTWVQLGSGGSSLWTDNTKSISRQNFYVLNTGETSDSTGLSINGGGAAGTRAFYDPDKGALRGGQIQAANDAWDAANIGLNSFGWGINAKAKGSYSVAFGTTTTATGARSIAAGDNATAGGLASAAFGGYNTASGDYSVTIGYSNTASGNSSVVLGKGSSASGAVSIALGQDAAATADYSMAIGLGVSSGADPKVSGISSMGIFMGDQPGYNLTASNRMAIVGGDLLIDDAGATGSQGCLRYDGTNSKLQYSDDCTTFNNLSSAGGSAMSAITAATTTNTIDNTNYAQAWNWSTLNTQSAMTMNANALTSGTMLGLASSSTALTGTMLGVTASGSNAANTGTAIKSTVSGTNSKVVPLMVTNLGKGNSFRVNDQTGDADTTPFIIDQSGNVGIGVTSTTYKLDLEGALAYTALMKIQNNDNTGIAGFEVYDELGNYKGVIGNFNFNYADAASKTATTPMGMVSNDQDIMFATGDDGVTAGTIRMVIDSATGSVGIGNTTPKGMLQITSNGTLDPELVFEPSGSNGGTISFNSYNDGTNDKYLTSDSAFSIFHDAGTDALNFYYAPAGTAGNNITYAGKEAMTILSNGDIGIHNTSPNVELDVTGDIEYTGTLTDVSDMRLKENIEPLIKTGSLLDRLDKVKTYSFSMKDDPTHRIEYGVMAQELEKIFPELVHTAKDKMGTKSVNYVGLIAPMIAATQELKAKNDALTAQISELKTVQAETNANLKDLGEQVAQLNKAAASGGHIGKASSENYLMILLGLLGGLGIAFAARRVRQGG